MSAINVNVALTAQLIIAADRADKALPDPRLSSNTLQKMFKLNSTH